MFLLGYYGHLTVRVFFEHQYLLLKDVFFIPLKVSYAFETELAMAIHTVMYVPPLGGINFGYSQILFILSLFYGLDRFWCCRNGIMLGYLENITCMKFHYSHIYREDNIIVDSTTSRASSICTTSW